MSNLYDGRERKAMNDSFVYLLSHLFIRRTQ
jgi:hypothetical protein